MYIQSCEKLFLLIIIRHKIICFNLLRGVNHIPILYVKTPHLLVAGPLRKTFSPEIWQYHLIKQKKIFSVYIKKCHWIQTKKSYTFGWVSIKEKEKLELEIWQYYPLLKQNAAWNFRVTSVQSAALPTVCLFNCANLGAYIRW